MQPTKWLWVNEDRGTQGPRFLAQVGPGPGFIYKRVLSEGWLNQQTSGPYIRYIYTYIYMTYIYINMICVIYIYTYDIIYIYDMCDIYIYI